MTQSPPPVGGGKAAVDTKQTQDAYLEPPTFDEFLVVETYKDSYKASITSLNGSCEKIVTAAFSIATAYGALIALVKPEDDVPGFWVALPIAVLTVAAVLGLIGHARGMRDLPMSDFDQVKSQIKGAIDAKKKWAWAAIVTLGCAVILGGVVTYLRYGRPAEAATTSGVEVVLTASGEDALADVCPNASSPLQAAEFAVDGSRAVIKDVKKCGKADLSLPRSQIVVTKTSQ